VNDHLPDCLMWDVKVNMCICRELRACEKRARAAEVVRAYASGHADGWLLGRNEARNAVEAAHAVDVASGNELGSPVLFVWMNDALNAIDSLPEARR